MGLVKPLTCINHTELCQTWLNITVSIYYLRFKTLMDHYTEGDYHNNTDIH